MHCVLAVSQQPAQLVPQTVVFETQAPTKQTSTVAQDVHVCPSTPQAVSPSPAWQVSVASRQPVQHAPPLSQRPGAPSVVSLQGWPGAGVALHLPALQLAAEQGPGSQLLQGSPPIPQLAAVSPVRQDAPP